MSAHPIAVIALDEDEERGHVIARCVRCGHYVLRWITHLGETPIGVFEDVARDHLLVCRSPAAGEARREREL